MFFGNVERVVDIPHTKGLHPLLDFSEKLLPALVHELASFESFVAMLLRIDLAIDLFRRGASLEYGTLPELTTAR